MFVCVALWIGLHVYVQMRNSSRQQHGILCLLLIVISFGNIKSSSALLVKSFQRALLLSVGRNNCNQPFCIRFSKITNENDINVSSDWTRQELTDFAATQSFEITENFGGIVRRSSQDTKSWAQSGKRQLETLFMLGKVRQFLSGPIG